MSDQQYGMLIDTSRCVGCQTCVIGCKILHKCPEGVYLGYLETVGSDENYVVSGSYPNVSITFQPHMCNHCENPVCVENCPTGAMHKRQEDGIVESDRDLCIACGTCALTCPYSAPVVNEEDEFVMKCDLCRTRIENDEEPLCVCSCPAEARTFGIISDDSSDISKAIKEKKAEVLLPGEGTNPSVYYC